MEFDGLFGLAAVWARLRPKHRAKMCKIPEQMNTIHRMITMTSTLGLMCGLLELGGDGDDSRTEAGCEA